MIQKYLWQGLSGLAAFALLIVSLMLWQEQVAHGLTREDRDRINTAFIAHLGEDAKATEKEEKAQRQKERALQESADNERKAKDEKIDRLNADLSAAQRELRKRPARPAREGGSSPASQAPQGGEIKGCTGAQLYSDDGLFLVGEAARAERLRFDYDELWGAYERARTAHPD